MTDRYVGIGGNDGNSGLTWALRKLTLNGAEDTPVVAGDTVYVGHGVYREMLIIDVSGTNGNPITYIGDVTGENTDGVGGIVRIAGSDDDQSATRANCIDQPSSSTDYRTFRGFSMDMASAAAINIDGSPISHIIEDCFISHSQNGIIVGGAAQDDCIIRRCVILLTNVAITFTSSAIDDRAHLVENCILMLCQGDILNISAVGGGTIKNCVFWGGSDGIDVNNALTGGQQWDVNNCIFERCISNVMEAVNLGELVEDYNTVFACGGRDTVSIGANSETYPALLNPPILLDGFQFPWWFGELSEWSQVRAITGTGESADDLLGITRPITSAKKSWGAIQFNDSERETGTTRGASTASIALHDAGVHQIFVPVTNVSTTIEVYCYREANYAGTNPRMVIKQPGVADRTTTDAAAASQWNQLTDTFTPSADTDFVVVELQSLNTAAAGNFEAFFDDLAVS